MYYFQQGGQVNPQQVMQQIAKLFQQLPPEAQEQLIQGLSQMSQQSQQQEQPSPEESQETMMRMGGVRPMKSKDNYYR